MDLNSTPLNRSLYISNCWNIFIGQRSRPVMDTAPGCQATHAQFSEMGEQNVLCLRLSYSVIRCCLVPLITLLNLIISNDY